MMLIQKIAFGSTGRLYRSVMPFGTYDKKGEVLADYHKNDINAIVVLASVDECLEKAGKNLHRLYESLGFDILSLEIEDFGVPDKDEAKSVILRVLKLLQKGQNIAVHCSAGIGRTGTFLACLAKEHWALSGDDAIGWVRGWIPSAVETIEQEAFVRKY